MSRLLKGIFRAVGTLAIVAGAFLAYAWIKAYYPLVDVPDQVKIAKVQEVNALALARFERMAQKNEKNPEAWEGIGLCNANLGRFDAAAHAYEKAARLRPETDDHYRALSLLYRQAGKDAEVVRVCQLLLKKNPDQPEINDRLGEAYRRLKKYPEAQAIYEQTLQRHPDNAQALFGLAAVHRKSGRHFQAFQDFQRGVWATVKIPIKTKSLK